MTSTPVVQQAWSTASPLLHQKHATPQKQAQASPRPSPAGSSPSAPSPPSSSKLSSGLRNRGSSTSSSAASNQKNLGHVPCKFFRQGACQAGNACPFSHSMESVDQSPCKYFQKGNCKFGSKCALAHLLPDGRRVNPRPHHHHHGSGHGSNHTADANGNASANGNGGTTNAGSATAAPSSARADSSTPAARAPMPASPAFQGQTTSSLSSSPASASAHQKPPMPRAPSMSHSGAPSPSLNSVGSFGSVPSNGVAISMNSAMNAPLLNRVSGFAVPSSVSGSNSAAVGTPLSTSQSRSFADGIFSSRSMSTSSTSLWKDRPTSKSLRTSSFLFSNDDSAIADDYDDDVAVSGSHEIHPIGSSQSRHSQLLSRLSNAEYSNSPFSSSVHTVSGSGALSSLIDDDPFQEEKSLPMALRDAIGPEDSRRASRTSMSLSSSHQPAIDIWSPSRYARTSFSELGNGSAVASSPRRILPIGTPDRSSTLLAQAASVSENPQTYTGTSYLDMLSSPRRDSTPVTPSLVAIGGSTAPPAAPAPRSSLFDDDLEDTQFFMEEEGEPLDHQSTRLRNLELMDS